MDDCDTIEEMKELITFAYDKYAEILKLRGNMQMMAYCTVSPCLKDSMTFEEFTGQNKTIIRKKIDKKEIKKQEKAKVKNVLTDCMLILKAKL